MSFILKKTFPSFFAEKKKTHIPLFVKQNAKFASLSYDDKRPEKLEHFGDYQSNLSNPELAVYTNPDTKEVNVSIRGTKLTSFKDLKADAGLLFNNLKNTEKYQDIQSNIKNIKEQFPNYKINAIGHSLGASIGRELANQNLVDKAYNFNEGISPFNPPKDSRNVSSIRVKGDIISYNPFSKGTISLEPETYYSHGLINF